MIPPGESAAGLVRLPNVSILVLVAESFEEFSKRMSAIKKIQRDPALERRLFCRPVRVLQNFTFTALRVKYQSSFFSLIFHELFP